VSLGSFGVIHGIVMEAEDIYLLKRYVKKISKTDALEIAKGMDFTKATFKIQEEIENDGTVNRPTITNCISILITQRRILSLKLFTKSLIELTIPILYRLCKKQYSKTSQHGWLILLQNINSLYQRSWVH
jgi:hypothetical protein